MKQRRTVGLKDRSPLPVLHFGAGRGTRLGLAAYEEFNSSSPGTLMPTFVDAQPGTALAMVAEARERGIPAQALEARVADVIDQLPTSEQTACVVVALDHGEPIAEIIEHTPPAIYVIGTLVIKIPSGPLYGLSFCLGPHDLEERRSVAQLFRRIAAITLPRGSSATFGELGELGDRAGEPFLRAALAHRMAGILRKTIARLRPEVSPLELTVDLGETAMPVFVVDGSDGETDPARLAAATLERVARPVLRGEPFAIAELLDDDMIRFHICRLRGDGLVIVDGGSQFDADGVDRDLVANRAQMALARAETNTLSPTRPVLTTD